MRQSKLFFKTFKRTPKEAEVVSHKLLLRGGFISQLVSGIYNFLPLGLKVHRKIEKIIRQEMDAIGAQEVFLPALQPKEIWEKTNRWNHMAPPLFKLKDRHNRELALGPTHEEVITSLAKPFIQSYKDLPRALYQIQIKFRNEVRSTGGLLRVREFSMKDLYSFHQSKNDLESFFQQVLLAYEKIYSRCSLEAIKSEASGGNFTKEKTYEFQVASKVGEDKILVCKKCKWAINLEVSNLKERVKCPQCGGKLEQVSSIEVGHTFRLGTRYSEALGLYFVDADGRKKPVIMGCYGIGIGRLMATVVEVWHDEKGIVWPKEVSPFGVHLIQIEDTFRVKKIAEKVYEDLQKDGVEVLYDERADKTPGEKFADADLIGIPLRMVISKKTLERNSVEIKGRKEEEGKLLKLNEIGKFLK